MLSKLNFNKKNVKIFSDHIVGLLEKEILKFFIKEKLIKLVNHDNELTEKICKELELIGIDFNINVLQTSKRKNFNYFLKVIMVSFINI
jgi:hypothetical protein